MYSMLRHHVRRKSTDDRASLLLRQTSDRSSGCNWGSERTLKAQIRESYENEISDQPRSTTKEKKKSPQPSDQKKVASSTAGKYRRTSTTTQIVALENHTPVTKISTVPAIADADQQSKCSSKYTARNSVSKDCDLDVTSHCSSRYSDCKKLSVCQPRRSSISQSIRSASVVKQDDNIQKKVKSKCQIPREIIVSTVSDPVSPMRNPRLAFKPRSAEGASLKKKDDMQLNSLENVEREEAASQSIADEQSISSEQVGSVASDKIRDPPGAVMRSASKQSDILLLLQHGKNKSILTINSRSRSSQFESCSMVEQAMEKMSLLESKSKSSMIRKPSYSEIKGYVDRGNQCAAPTRSVSADHQFLSCMSGNHDILIELEDDDAKSDISLKASRTYQTSKRADADEDILDDDSSAILPGIGLYLKTPPQESQDTKYRSPIRRAQSLDSHSFDSRSPDCVSLLSKEPSPQKKTNYDVLNAEQTEIVKPTEVPQPKEETDCDDGSDGSESSSYLRATHLFRGTTKSESSANSRKMPHSPPKKAFSARSLISQPPTLPLPGLLSSPGASQATGSDDILFCIQQAVKSEIKSEVKRQVKQRRRNSTHNSGPMRQRNSGATRRSSTGQLPKQCGRRAREKTDEKDDEISESSFIHDVDLEAIFSIPKTPLSPPKKTFKVIDCVDDTFQKIGVPLTKAELKLPTEEVAHAISA